MSNYRLSDREPWGITMSNEPMKIPIDYAESAESLKKILGLKGSPVALKLASSKEEIPAGMQ